MNKIKTFLLQQLFKPSLIGFFINPFFLGRSAMYINVKKLSKHISGKTLDVGCGSKPYIKLFNNVSEYTGMDIEQSGHKHQYSSIDVFYDGKTFPFENDSFDSLVFFEVLEHVFNPEIFFNEIKKVVKPGGNCLVTIPFIWGEHEQPFDFARYSSFGLNHLFKTNGFEMIPTKQIKGSLPATFSALEQIMVFRFSGGRIAGTRTGDRFHILFIDHNFTLYKH